MDAPFEPQPVFLALTRPQMFAGVSWTWCVANFIIAAELFLIFKSVFVLLAACLVHVFGVIVSLREPRMLDLWIVRMSCCPRVPNFRLWGCNSYQP